MTYEGTVKGSVIVLDPGTSLPEGARVRVEPIPHPQPATRDFHPVGSWEGPPGELDHLLTEVQALRDVELTEDR